MMNVVTGVASPALRKFVGKTPEFPCGVQAPEVVKPLGDQPGLV
jgi:hypothetical protein